MNNIVCKKNNNVAVIGAGKTGRGFVARLLAEAGMKICFVDTNEKLVSELNICADEGTGYSVHFFGNVRPSQKIENYRAYSWDNICFDDCDVIFVSVGGLNLTDVGKKLNEKLPRDRRIVVIVCENAVEPAKTLYEAIGYENVKVTEATVFCTTIEDKENGLDINSENYPYLQYDADRLDGQESGVASIKPVANFENFLTRKLFTYNAASCVIAYLGFIKGYKVYSEAAADKQILELLDQNYAVTNAVMCKAFGYEEKDQQEFARLSREKFTSTAIKDTVARNAREPQRKLGPDERIIGPMKMIYKYGLSPDVLMMTTAAALLYKEEGNTEWNRIRTENTPQQILDKICCLGEEDRILNEGIMKHYDDLVQNRGVLWG